MWVYVAFARYFDLKINSEFRLEIWSHFKLKRFILERFTLEKVAGAKTRQTGKIRNNSRKRPRIAHRKNGSKGLKKEISANQTEMMIRLIKRPSLNIILTPVK